MQSITNSKSVTSLCSPWIHVLISLLWNCFTVSKSANLHVGGAAAGQQISDLFICCSLINQMANCCVPKNTTFPGACCPVHHPSSWIFTEMNVLAKVSACTSQLLHSKPSAGVNPRPKVIFQRQAFVWLRCHFSVFGYLAAGGVEPSSHWWDGSGLSWRCFLAPLTTLMPDRRRSYRWIVNSCVVVSRGDRWLRVMSFVVWICDCSVCTFKES